jgi:hypothetical protein
VVFHVISIYVVLLYQESLASEIPDVFLDVLKLPIYIKLCKRRRRQLQESLEILAFETAKPDLLLQSCHSEYVALPP